MKKLLKALTETSAPSGYEEALRALVMKEVKPLADEVRVDALGNVIARVKPSKGAKNPKKVMLAANMDEGGLIASHIDKNGFVRFATIGNVNAQYALGARVRFLNGVGGVVACGAADDELIPFNKMVIDVGATGAKDCPIKAGDVAAFVSPFAEMGTRLIAKRACVAALIESLRALKSTPNDLYFVFAVQGEVGARGAKTATFGIDPDIGLVLSLTQTGDAPSSIKSEIKLGDGPCVKIRDATMIADPRVTEWITRAAGKARIPIQREVLTHEIAANHAMQISRAGVAAGGLSIPARYVHSAVETVDFTDLQNSAKLIQSLLGNPIPL